ncbi:(2,3-dihydroxybenzoyl)adenylate synthase [Nocardiopsis baichengensis]|uniref:(2,3-dihydroxybenzoyl)adenylate synthase n=1 Tax=Nocardiopsis baichengensis TaxID=280240 RepID=UPI00034D51E6|nr:AMP-binding protein [Nocardiopsis baichengensis]WNB50045.1 2,3-dihydroxybenzoyl adenylate synthase [Nocardiopsis baichengensis]
MRHGCTPWPEEFADRYRAAGYWTGRTLGGLLRDGADRFADRTAVVSGDRRWTYAELDGRADRLATGLARRLDLAPGDPVVVQLPNTAEVLEVVFALFRIGALPVYALPAHRSAEVSHLVAATGARALVTASAAGFDHVGMALRVAEEAGGPRSHVVDAAPGAADAPREGAVALEALRSDTVDPGVFTAPDPADVAFFQLSGGTTGLPKLIPRTHDDYLYSVRASADICELGPDTVYLSALPVVHNFPMSSPGFLGVLYAGGSVVMAPDPSPATCLGLIESEGVTLAAAVPPVALLWLDAVERGAESGRDLSSLRMLQVGGAKFAPEAARRVAPVLGCRLQQVFGMAEGLVNYTRPEDDEATVTGTQGRPISPDDEIRIVRPDGTEADPGEPGELLTRGPYTIRGYYDAPVHNARAFTPDGFYRTGDVVRLTPTGHLVVEGRVKDQINRGGEKIAPDEVEDHILAHPDVHDAAVVAMPDAYLGERACAYVIPREGGGALTRPVLLRFLRERGLASYKIPDRVEVVPEFPATGVGKVSRRDLRAAIADALARPAERA